MVEGTVYRIWKELYPATYTFRDEADATSGTDIEFVDADSSSANCTIQIISDLGNHRKVLELYDNNAAGYVDFYHLFSSIQTDQTIEFWLRCTDVTQSNSFTILLKEAGNIRIQLAIRASNFQYYDVAWNAVLACVNDTWYHHKIVWDDTNNTFDWFIDGVLQQDNGAYRNNSTIGIDRIEGYSHVGTADYYTYIDAWGEAWDTSYAIGDNTQWRFLKDDADTSSDFESEDWGTSGTSIGFVSAATLYDAELIIDLGFDEHKKVLRLQDDATAGEDPYFGHAETQATAGHRELYFKTNDVTEEWQIMWYENGAGYIVRLKVTASNLYYLDSVDAWQLIQAVANDTWYHLIMKFYANNTFDLWIDGIQQIDGIATNNNMVDGVEYFYMRGYGDSEDYLYLDGYGDITNDASYDSADNRRYEYKGDTKEDISAYIQDRCKYYLNFYEPDQAMLTCSLNMDSTQFIQLYDSSGVLRFEGDLDRKVIDQVFQIYHSRTSNDYELNEQLTTLHDTAKLFDPTDSTSILWATCPHITQASGELLLDWANCDTESNTYTMRLRNFPRKKLLRTIADGGDTCIMRKVDKLILDSDNSSGLTITQASDTLCRPPEVSQVLTDHNYFTVYGSFDPHSGQRLSKTIDNSGDNKKKPYWTIKPHLDTQTDVDNYCTALASRVGLTGNPYKLGVTLQGETSVWCGQTVNFAYSIGDISLSATNYYVTRVIGDMIAGTQALTLTEGMIELSEIFLENHENFEEPLDDQLIRTYLSWGPNIYSCYDESDIADALTAIGANYGVIRIHGTIELSTSIGISGGGNYIIEGVNAGSVIDCGGDRSAFIISSADKTMMRNFKIDASDITTASEEVINCTSGYLECYQVKIIGDNPNKNGYGIWTNNIDVVRIDKCDFSFLKKGININTGIKHVIRDCTLAYTAEEAIYLNDGDYSIVSGNIVDTANSDRDAIGGIYIVGTLGGVISNNIVKGTLYAGIDIETSSVANVISGNVCIGNDDNNASNVYGILIEGDDNVVSGNVSSSNNNSGAGTGYGIYISANADETTVVGNCCLDNDTNFDDNGTNTTTSGNNIA